MSGALSQGAERFLRKEAEARSAELQEEQIVSLRTDVL
jgi:hypothetical protein